jgi:hypothetical protein
MLHAFLTSVLDGSEWSALRPSRFTPGEKAPGTQWIGGWVGPIASLEALAKRKKYLPLPEIEPRSSSPHQST